MAKRKKRKSSKKPGGINLEHYLKQKLRRASYAWPPRKEAIKNARISRGKYKCAVCEGEGFGPKEIQIDHIRPVIDPHDGFVDFNTYIERLFCDVSGYQALCKPCHSTKSAFENVIRREVKNENKKDEGEDL